MSIKDFQINSKLGIPRIAN